MIPESIYLWSALWMSIGWSGRMSVDYVRANGERPTAWRWLDTIPLCIITAFWYRYLTGHWIPSSAVWQ